MSCPNWVQVVSDCLMALSGQIETELRNRFGVSFETSSSSLVVVAVCGEGP